jgi:hypothetical protein
LKFGKDNPEEGTIRREDDESMRLGKEILGAVIFYG